MAVNEAGVTRALGNGRRAPRVRGATCQPRYTAPGAACAAQPHAEAVRAPGAGRAQRMGKGCRRPPRGAVAMPYPLGTRGRGTSYRRAETPFSSTLPGSGWQGESCSGAGPLRGTSRAGKSPRGAWPPIRVMNIFMQPLLQLQAAVIPFLHRQAAVFSAAFSSLFLSF